MGGHVGGGIVRALTAVATVGGSELIRKKPFQPGGEGNELDKSIRVAKALTSGGATELARSQPFQSAPDRNDQGNVVGLIAPGIDVAKKTGLLPAPPPSLPPDTSAIDVANKAKDAENAVLSAEAEGRRARAAKRVSSVLSNATLTEPGSTSVATLQPRAARRSVLG